MTATRPKTSPANPRGLSTKKGAAMTATRPKTSPARPRALSTKKGAAATVKKAAPSPRLARKKQLMVDAPTWCSGVSEQSSPLSPLAMGTLVRAKLSKRLCPGFRLLSWFAATVVAASPDGYVVEFPERRAGSWATSTALVPSALVWPAWESPKGAAA